MSKNVLKSFQTSVELVFRYFSGKKYCLVHPGGSKHGKTSEKWKNFHFFPNAQKWSPKSTNTYWTCFEVVFSVKKNWPVHPRVSKLGKIRKKYRKKYENSKVFKNVPKSFQTCFEVILSKFFVQCTLEGREVEKFQKNGKKSNFQNPEKRFQKRPNLFWGDFFRTFLDQRNLEIKTCRNSKKNRKKLNS